MHKICLRESLAGNATSDDAQPRPRFFRAEQATSDCITSRQSAAAIGYTEVECVWSRFLELGGFRVDGYLSCGLAGSDLVLRGEYKLF